MVRKKQNAYSSLLHFVVVTAISLRIRQTIPSWITLLNSRERQTVWEVDELLLRAKFS
ncbi:hypothetical protein LINGRAHAP2_LOCUS33294 [Linum grandiflorum]